MIKSAKFSPHKKRKTVEFQNPETPGGEKVQYYATSVDHILAELRRFDMLIRAQVWQRLLCNTAFMRIPEA